VNSNSNQRSTVTELMQQLILEDDQFDVHDILPNTVPDPASLTLSSDYACPVGQVVMAPDCGELFFQEKNVVIYLSKIAVLGVGNSVDCVNHV